MNMNPDNFIEKVFNPNKPSTRNTVQYVLYGLFCFMIGMVLSRSIMNDEYDITTKTKSFSGVKQRIENTAYITKVFYKDQTIDYSMDFINDYDWNDTIICYRYDEGIKLIKQYQRIDSIKSE